MPNSEHDWHALIDNVVRKKLHAPFELLQNKKVLFSYTIEPSLLGGRSPFFREPTYSLPFKLSFLRHLEQPSYEVIITKWRADIAYRIRMEANEEIPVGFQPIIEHETLPIDAAFAQSIMQRLEALQIPVLSFLWPKLWEKDGITIIFSGTLEWQQHNAPQEWQLLEDIYQEIIDYFKQNGRGDIQWTVVKEDVHED